MVQIIIDTLKKIGDIYKFDVVKDIEDIEQFKNPANGLYNTKNHLSM